jgi:hypothetical protein
MRSSASCGARDGSSVLSLGELFRVMSHFYECCIYSIHSCFWQFWLLSSCYSFTRVCPSGLRSPIFLFAYSYVPHWPSLCPSALVHSNHMAFPPLTISTWNCDPLPRCPSLWFSLLFQHSSLCRSYNMQYSSFHLPLASLKHLLLHVWAPYDRTRNTPDFFKVFISVF